MSIDDPVIRQSYDAYIQACLDCVVTGIKFMAFVVQDDFGGGVIKPHYLPYHYIAGFNKLYDEEIAEIATTKEFDDDNQEKFVNIRRSKGLPLYPFEAYREHFDRFDPRFDSQRLPVRSHLIGHFRPEKRNLYSSIASLQMMCVFCKDAMYKPYETRSLRYRYDSVTFNLEALACDVNYHTGGSKEEFEEAALEHCDAIGRLMLANRQTASIFMEYLKENAPKDVRSLVLG